MMYEMRKSKMQISIFIFILSIICTVVYTCTANSIEDRTQRSIDEFLKCIAENEITKVEVYYLAWGDPTNFTSENDLLNGKFDYKVTAKSMTVSSHLQKLSAFLGNMDLEGIKKNNFDCRNVFCFLSRQKGSAAYDIRY